MKEDINRALEVLRSGGVILYPTDTIWGLGCDATNPEAVEKIYRIKERDPNKSMLILVDYPARVERYVEDMPDIAWDLIEVTNKPLTIIYHQAQNLAENLVASDGSIGIRVVQDKFCQQLITRFGRPVVSTSANLANQPAPANFKEIDRTIIDSVDYVVKWRQNETKKSSPSGIIKLGPGGEVEVIRE
ncbi:MAG: L-threonylcarbamoyladenylate synthase [Bacteroidales bacterium]|nr:threonylcarbamoyl-AMP synthase [Bacteroidales bacterium]MBS3774719.1 threonylcarbamoyl-AMP synthase [Bacteroidales bacterium]